MIVLPEILRTAIVAGLVIGVIAWIAVWFNGKSQTPVPSHFIWLIAFVVWLLWVFFGGSVTFA